MYDRRIAGKELTFGVSGKLHANSLIMYDHQTDSLWSHLAEAAVTGSLKGKKLIPMESMLTRWDTWLGLYPSTKIMTSGRRPIFGLLRDPYEGDQYYTNPQIIGVRPTRQSDRRFRPKEFVVGLVLNDKAKAYPFSVLSRQVIVNDTFERIPLVVVFDKKSATGVVFRRKKGGRTLSFKNARRDGKEGVYMADDATGSVWEGLTGRAVEGNKKGQKLNPLPTIPSFWFGWVDHYPKTTIYGGGQ